MGSFCWVFQRVADGEVVPLSMARFEEWRRGKRAVLPTADGYVHIILVAGPCVDRQPMEVQLVELSRHEVTPEGIYTRELAEAHGRDALEHMDDTPFPPGNVLDGRRRFERARYRARWSWKPTQADTAAIRAAVNRKAKRRIL